MRRTLWAFFLACGCGAPPARELADAVRRETAARIGADAVAAADDERARLLADGLTPDEAVRLALANAPDAEVALAALGVARGEWVRAGAPPDPEIDAELRFALDGEGSSLELALLQDVTGFLALPSARRAATARLDAARLRAVEAAVDRAGAARAAYAAVQADLRVVELRRTALEVTSAALDVARRLYAAGNVTALEVDLEQAEVEEARLALVAAEAALGLGRARLERLLGLSGAEWQPAEPLLEVPADDGVDLEAAEGRAVERSLALAALRREEAEADAGATHARIAGRVPRLALGASAEREADGAWAVGPALSLGLPFFDRGVALAEARQREAGLRLQAGALDVRSAARQAAARLRAARARAVRFARVVVPLRQRILEQSVLQFNAMNLGIFELLRARRAVAEAGVRHAFALREYWLARADLDRLLAGGSPVGASAPREGERE